MKKFLTILCAAITAVGLSLGITACNKVEVGKYKVYAPDGAPALALAQLCTEEKSEYAVNVVKASTITTYVTGEEPKADFAIVPVNAAVKMLGSGEKYQMLGTVTHGNLFLLKKTNGEEITTANISTLVGKTVGVINLANVPGLMLKVILQQYNIPFNQLTEGNEVATDKVNLKNISDEEAKTAINPANTECDYFVVPEPAATTKINVTQGKLSVAASLQTLYGGENGYPQAVAVAKTSVIESDKKAVENFIKALKDNQSWINDSDTSAETIVNAIRSKMSGDLAPTFTAENLNVTVIANCGIRFTSNADGKQSVLDVISKLNAVSNNAWGTPADTFFYGIN
ncbi:MAG: hypothetical protein ACI4MB_06120 [Candidatus Coproplasma sp.]